ncbi:MAG: hypothetical protein HY334_03970 [Armatimonadetes bacterium]|nr:hypothetical protein [Armatimonadota bacterium]
MTERPPAGFAIAPPFASVLRLLHTGLAGGAVRWAVASSLGVALPGVPVTPRDVDLQTDEGGAYEIARRFSAYITRPVAFTASEKIRSHFGTLVIESITVEIMGGIQKRSAGGRWEDPVDIAPHLRFVEIGGLRIPVLSLTYEYEAYRALGRTAQADLLLPWVDRHG